MSDSGGDAGGGGGDIFEVDAGGGDGEGGDSGEEVDPFEQYRNMPSPPNTIFVFKSGGSEGSCGCPRTSSIFVETSTNLPGSLEGYLSLDEFHEITRSATKIFNETSFAICPAAICIFIICCLACCRSCASSKRRKLIEEFAAAMSHKLDAKGLTLSVSSVPGNLMVAADLPIFYLIADPSKRQRLNLMYPGMPVVGQVLAVQKPMQVVVGTVVQMSSPQQSAVMYSVVPPTNI